MRKFPPSLEGYISYPVPLSMIRKYDDDFNNQSWFVVMDVICRRTNIWNFALPAIMWAGLSGADLPKINRGLLYKSHPTSEMETRLFFSTPPRPFQWLTS